MKDKPQEKIVVETFTHFSILWRFYFKAHFAFQGPMLGRSPNKQGE